MNDGKIRLRFIVNGRPHEDEFGQGMPMKTVIEKVLKDTNNTGQPIENWTLKDKDGNPLDMKQHLKDYGFEDGTELYLTTGEGGGGALIE